MSISSKTKRFLVDGLADYEAALEVWEAIDRANANADNALGIVGIDPTPHAIFVKIDGSTPFTADQSMGGNKITNLSSPAADFDAATKKYVDDTAADAQSNAQAYADSQDAAYVPLAGATMTGAIDMDGNAITNLPDPTNPADPVTLSFLTEARRNQDDAIVTTDDVETILATIALDDNSVYRFTVALCAFRSDDVGPGQCATYGRSITAFRTAGGDATFQGTSDDVGTDQNSGAPFDGIDFGLSVDGDNVVLSVIGLPQVTATKVDQDITYVANPVNYPGAAGNAITIEYINDVVASNESAENTGTAIKVHIEDGVSTANQIITALDAALLSMFISYSVTGTGTNVQSAHAAQNLIDGETPTISWTSETHWSKASEVV